MEKTYQFRRTFKSEGEKYFETCNMKYHVSGNSIKLNEKRFKHPEKDVHKKNQFRLGCYGKKVFYMLFLQPNK